MRTPILALLILASACSSSKTRPASQPPPRAALAMGYQATSAAIANAQREARERPEDPGAYVALARAFVAARRASGDAAMLALAGDALDAAESLGADRGHTMAVRGVLLAEGHRFAELAELAEQMIAASPNDTTGYLLLGDARLERGDYAGAAAAYDQAMERYPDLRVYARGAHLRWLYGDRQGALELYEDAIGSAGRNPEHLAWVYTDVGQVLLRGGSPERARAAAERAEALVPGYPPAAALRARAARAAGDLDAADAAIRAALAARTSAADQLFLAEVAEARGDRATAAAAREAGLELAGHDRLPVALYLARRGEQTARALELAVREASERETIFAESARALALLRAGRAAEAAAAIEAALALGTPLADLHLHDGLIKLALGDRDGARAARRRARDLDPYARPALAAELDRGLAEVIP